MERPELNFTKKNGVMTGVEFSLSLENSENWPPSYQEQMMLLSLAFVCAQEECNIFSEERSDMLRLIEDSKFKSFEFSYFGVEGSCEVEYSGYEDVATSMNVLWPKEGEKNRFEMKFRLEKKRKSWNYRGNLYSILCWIHVAENSWNMFCIYNVNIPFSGCRADYIYSK